MTREDFVQWLRHHRANFRSLDAWLTKMGADAARETQEAWLRALGRMLVDDAIRASDEMLRDFEHKPRNFDDHPARILRIAHLARERSNAPAIGQSFNRYDYGLGCSKCNGGLIRIFLHGEVMKKAYLFFLAGRKRPEEALRMAQTWVCMAACGCPAGARAFAEGGYERYDPTIHELADGNGTGVTQELISAVVREPGEDW